MKFMTSIRETGGITIVDISGKIVLGEESAALRTLISDLLVKGRKKILFNLGNVSYIDSSGLGFLVSAFASVKREGGELKLLNLTSNVQDVMQMTKLYTIFDIQKDERVAVQSFGHAIPANV
jgi:anti-sigma B factor antagonist